MKLIAVDATGKRWVTSIIEYDTDGTVSAILVYNNDDTPRIFQPAEATLHVSTCMFDKNGSEILVGVWCRDQVGVRRSVVTDGRLFYSGASALYKNVWMREVLTPELAATMEVVE